LVALERQLQRHGVRVVSCAEENGDGPLADLIRGQLALIAEYERAMIRERLSAGKARAKQLGRHVHGRVPYGYHTPTRGVLEPDPATAPIVERIFRLARQGVNPARIARELNTDGIPAPAGAEWRRSGVIVILRNVAYTGERYGVKKAHAAIITRRAYNDVTRKLESAERHG
jgi:DNA invertase Pin-like site-specific DNA recombinase